MSVQVRILDHIDDVSPAEWNRLAGNAQPFLRHEFLSALESSGSVGAGCGWIPQHAVIEEAGRLCAGMPLYRKTNSWGEFVFDWAWADAYRRAGLRYFPKLVAGIPFTPVTGPRLLTDPGSERARAAAALLAGALEHAREIGASSLHVLFPESGEAQECRASGLLLRKDCQFHWHNRGYATFDDFLGQFTAEKRKKARRERRRVAEAGISFRVLSGSEMDEPLWAAIMPLYGSSFWRRGRDPYLNEAFFRAVARSMPDRFIVILALKAATPVAVAILFRGESTLYGRYWGSSGDYHSLHFETCYYQGIEYCIRNGLATFEPGTQGEHKIARGFVPTEVWSAHWLSNPRFAAAIDQYLNRERAHIDEYMDVAQDHVPYRRERR
jgi:predicted N-acyltransferase